MAESTYDRKRRFDETPEPPLGTVSGDVDPLSAPPGSRFVIQQHHATRLHHDVRLEMMNGSTPVLVSWAVPKGLPRARGSRALAVRTEDHPMGYATFSGTIPDGSYGAGEVRIFDSGTYEMLKRDDEKITFRLDGRRLHGVYHLVRTPRRKGKEEWLALMSEDLRPAPEPPPPALPMLATLADGPFDDPAWGFEPKWDGIRAIAVCDEATRLVSRNSIDVTAGYPELRRLHEQVVALDAMLDGEIVAFEGGVPSFQRLQGRMHVRDPAHLERLVKTIPVTFIAFDLLYLDGRDLTGLPLSERSALLAETIVPDSTVQVSPSVVGEGSALFAAAAESRLEGIVAKKLSSPYEPGARSRSWLKVKVVFDADVVVVGWTEGEGRRQGRLGSLVMGMYDEGSLRYVGKVGTGFNERSLDEATRKLEALATAESPFDPPVRGLGKVHWARPETVATVTHRQVTAAGRLRAPSFQGFRDDKRPEECTVDQLTPVTTDG